MTVPDGVRDRLRAALWAEADRLHWLHLSQTAKSTQYEAWTRSPETGGMLARYIALGDVRVYIKDTLMKDYARARQADSSVVYRVLGIAPSCVVAKRFVKPHGRQLADGRFICWGRATDWKTILMTAYERARQGQTLRPAAIVLTHAAGRYKQDGIRSMIQNAASRLGIEQLQWMDV